MLRVDGSQEYYMRWFSANCYFLTIVVLGTLRCRELEQSFYWTETQHDELQAQNLQLEAARKAVPVKKLSLKQGKQHAHKLIDKWAKEE